MCVAVVVVVVVAAAIIEVAGVGRLGGWEWVVVVGGWCILVEHFVFSLNVDWRKNVLTEMRKPGNHYLSHKSHNFLQFP